MCRVEFDPRAEYNCGHSFLGTRILVGIEEGTVMSSGDLTRNMTSADEDDGSRKMARGRGMNEATGRERPVTRGSLMLKTRAMISQSRAQ